MIDVMISVSVGELFDRITILEIKQQRFTGQAQHNVQHELRRLQHTASLFDGYDLQADIQALSAVNQRLWHIEEDLRDMEQRQDFGPDFMHRARQVYINNDERSAIKRRISARVGSTITEEKNYSTGADR